MADDDPIARFRELFEQARAAETHDHTAVCLATADAEGRPAARMVLLKGVDEAGFIFYTSYASRKGSDLALNPRAALCFFWPALYTQVRVEGRVERVSAEESDAYFTSRPRGHQLAAWASRQGEVLTGRHGLLERYDELAARFGEEPIPRPPYWGGYRLRPDRVEFWHGFENRLHDRILFSRTAAGWTESRLNP
jgi:pyridoxamine 5'-phosphate oxidase